FQRGERRLDVRNATTATFKLIKVGQLIKSGSYSSEPHSLSAAWAMRRFWRALSRAFGGHGQNGPWAEMSPRTRAEMYSVASIKACEFRTTDCFDVPLNQSTIRTRQPTARRVLNNWVSQIEPFIWSPTRALVAQISNSLAQMIKQTGRSFVILCEV